MGSVSFLFGGWECGVGLVCGWECGFVVFVLEINVVGWFWFFRYVFFVF